MAKLLGRMGYACKRPKRVPAKADAQARQAFLDGVLHRPSGNVVTREAGEVTAAEMIALFEGLAERHSTATAINVVLDNATYNRAAVVRD